MATDYKPTAGRENYLIEVSAAFDEEAKKGDVDIFEFVERWNLTEDEADLITDIGLVGALVMTYGDKSHTRKYKKEADSNHSNSR